MSTSLSQAASLDDEPLPMDLASSLDKNAIPDVRIRGTDISSSTFDRLSTPPATTTTLLPPLPISPPRAQQRSYSASPPSTPPSGPSAQFSTPVGPSPSQSSRKTPGRSNDSPALMSPFRGQGDRTAPAGPGRSPTGRPTTPKPNPWHPSLQSQSGRSGTEPQVEQSPSRWHRQSFARGGGSSDDDGEDRLVEGMEYSLILVPHESEEEFMSNVHRIVPDGEVGTPSPEERTPSPVIPGTEGVQPAAKGSGRSRLEGGNQAGPSILSPYPGTPRRPETRPARVGPKSHTPVIPQRRGRPDMREAPARTRLTRARDAKEAEEAIALVDALEAQTTFPKPKGKGKDTQGRSKSRGKSAVRGEPADIVMQPSTPPRRQSPLPHPAPAHRHVRNSSQTTNSPLPKSLILAEKGVAIAVSPIKGRRLRLLRPSTPPAAVFGSSPPKFEENISPAIRRWLAGPRSPPSSPPKPREKKRPREEERPVAFAPDALAALGIRIDAAPQFSAEVEAAVQTQERDSRKRKRLEAFKDSSSDSSTDKATGETQQPQVGLQRAVAKTLARPRRVSPLKPAQVDGLGRMAIHPGDLQGAQVIPMAAVESGQTWRKTLFGLDVQEEDESLMSDVTTGGAGLRNLWRHRPQKSDSSNMPNIAFPDESANDTRLSQSLPEQGPGWPDLGYPWSMNEAERRKERQRKRNERMAMVEAFLTRESDSDSDSDMPATSISGAEDDVAGVRGLWSIGNEELPGGSNVGPEPRIADKLAKLFPVSETGLLSASPLPLAPPDPADARVALASRRDVRSTLYFSEKRREEGEADDGVVDCICGEPDDGRAMVRCDGCKTWSHQACAGISDENELGECWYCAQCVRETASTTHDGSAPTLVQSDASPERVVERAERRTTLFMATPDEENRASSPMDISSSPARETSPWPFLPKTPRAKESRSAAFSKTPSHLFESRLHQTPRFFPDPEDLGSANASLDLLATPSRGTKYNVAFVPTSSPRQSSSTSAFRRPLVGSSVLATPKNTFSRRFGGGDNSAETALGSEGGWSVAATVKDQPGLPATPRQHYSMSGQYTDTPIQRSRPRMGNPSQANASLSAPFDSPIVRQGNNSAR
ncbi:hypothetical protein M407DRAFT_25854 [Tulasnella calospora MUT 4182]|uniref:PHD-type domain-containing protein n=1 Tax=Tulasnella calospora MUT 4182 TaxID=1051891 RepID=A0A0C3LTX1_9AGAM|nr:hypothetical protein M407DRAFT_25854 [Tulasnella calospora MUT 4182]